ncbi:hypothetical protein [Bartonella sp. WD16.2]|uniref:hypothetical protein n=1 Tax=Bartonella sp. WD16.2 TaxID=1933904 RepID=UPI000999B379|nr:hypothetical protein [Bartonella sp. WD16.2]
MGQGYDGGVWGCFLGRFRGVWEKKASVCGDRLVALVWWNAWKEEDQERKLRGKDLWMRRGIEVCDECWMMKGYVRCVVEVCWGKLWERKLG